jgi:hypothetical protein
MPAGDVETAPSLARLQQQDITNDVRNVSTYKPTDHTIVARRDRRPFIGIPPKNVRTTDGGIDRHADEVKLLLVEWMQLAERR